MTNNISTLTALVLAGGKGTRLAGLHPGVPKPMVPVKGKPFLYWLTLWLIEQGIRNFVFSVGHHGDQIEAWLAGEPMLQNVNWKSFRETQPLGTGGAARACLHLCRDDILISNGDSLTMLDVALCATELEDTSIDGVLAGKFVEDASRYGNLEVDPNNFLREFKEKQSGKGIINSGIYFFRKKVLEFITPDQNLSMEYDVMPGLLLNKARIAVKVISDDTPFLDIGTPESLAQADKFVSLYLT